MSIGKIVAPLTGGERDKVVLATAFAAARPFAAHVIALFVRPDPAEAMPFFGEGVSSVVVQEIVDVARDAADKAAELARATLSAIAGAENVTLADGLQQRDGVSASFRDVQGSFTDCISKCARLSDLVVFGPLREDEKPGLTEAFEETLRETGRPVLLSAIVPANSFVETIALAYDGSLPSAHAVTAALPYLKKASRIEILNVQRGGGEQAGVAELCGYLALHRISCGSRAIEQGVRQTGEVLLETAAQVGAGMIVLGGYGHSRLRQFLAGGVTRHVVSHATIPLFLVH